MNLEKYTFPTIHGKMLSTEPFPDGNMLRSTAELLLLSELDPWDVIAYRNGIEDCRHDLGKFSRYPDKLENTSIDDYLVVGTIPIYAEYILTEARRNLGVISVDGKWSIDKFLPRFQGMWQHLRIIAGEKVGILGQAIWALSLCLAAQKPVTDQDNWVLSHLMVLSYQQNDLNSIICDLAIKYWRSKKTRQTHEIMAEYTGIPDHPLVEAWKPYN